MTVMKNFLRVIRTLGVIIVLGTLTLTACSAITQYSVLDRAATSADTLPAGAVNSDAELVPGSSRFIGVDDGVSLWLAAPKNTKGICLVVETEEQDSAVSCAGSALEVELKSGPHYAVYPDGMPDKEGMRRISENVFAFAD